MSDPEKPKTIAHPESSITASELGFDDVPQWGTPAPSHARAAIPAATTALATLPLDAVEDVPPPKPPRPLSPQQQAENTLKEAFPSIDAVVVRAVLTASGGQIEPAFNALLGMTDPDSQREPAPPPQPPRPVQIHVGPTSTAQSQVKADEQYARQLAEHYSGSSPYSEQPTSTSGGRRDPNLQKPKRDTGLKPNGLYDDRDHSFLDDDLPVIKENIRKGFLETQSKVNSWVANLKKKIDGEDDEEFQSRPARPATGYTSGPPTQPYGIRRSGEFSRRSGDRDRYDADPQVLSDDFTSLQLRDEEGTTAPVPSSSHHI
ncbi:Ubiquitin system component Cue [Lasallia pustulata]|uniref:Ubiquitin system component Cue n=1 Tax=Lasallia pustulata TaxID=136370 RepID=A0A1W5DEF2_9LECA|nr:Ubiquitin system component Cue [Lasallia pustulata]